MALGKAYIEVHADTKPFARELGRELDAIIRASEKTVRVSGRRVGSSIGNGVAQGVRKESKKVANGLNQTLKDTAPIIDSWFGKITKGLIDTIDDGVSGLPDELKVVLGAALIAALPLIVALGSAIAAALTAGLTLGGLAGFAILVGSQIDSVKKHFTDFTEQVQKDFASATSWLAGPINTALDMIASRFKKLLPDISYIAQAAVSVLQPMIDAFFGLVQFALPGLKRALLGISRFFVPLQVGFRQIGEAVGRFFDNILNNPQAVEAFYDLLVFVRDLVIVFTDLVTGGLALYGVLRKIAETLGLVEPVTQEVAELAKQYGIGATNAGNFNGAVSGGKTALQEQKDLIEKINNELETYTNLLYESGNLDIAYQEHLDDLTESVKRNGRSLKTGTKEGRENAQALRQLALDALKTRQNTIDLTGNVDEANRKFAQQRAEIITLAQKLHLSADETNNLVGQLLTIPPPQETGPSQSSVGRLREYYNLLKSLQNLPNVIKNVISTGISAGVGAVKAHADGGVFSRPHMGLVAEAGPEAIIPLNRPARAAQVLNDSGLSSMMAPNINVYIGNQQIDAYIDSRVSSAMKASSRSLSYGTRAI